MKNINNSTNSFIETNIIDINNELHTSNNMEINIHKLITDLENIGNEKEKEEFIKNYSKIKQQLSIVDNILLNENDIDCKNIQNVGYETKDINELLSILETNEDKIFNMSSNLTVGELKSLMEICNILEKKINDETMNIIENK